MVRTADARIGESGMVIPTRVGMVRNSSDPNAHIDCDPHARGDGPFSIQSIPAIGQVIPTRVGMVR